MEKMSAWIIKFPCYISKVWFIWYNNS